MVILWTGKNITVIEFCLFNMYVEHVYAYWTWYSLIALNFFFFSFFYNQNFRYTVDSNGKTYWAQAMLNSMALTEFLARYMQYTVGQIIDGISKLTF